MTGARLCVALLVAVAVGLADSWRYDAAAGRWVLEEGQQQHRQGYALDTYDSYQQYDPYDYSDGYEESVGEERKADGKGKDKCKKDLSGRCLSRKERELLLPNGFSLHMEPKIGFNVYSNDEMGTLRVLVKTDFSYKPPKALVKDGRRALRSSQTTMHKQVLYNTFSTTISRFGVDGDACLRRAICEVAEAPLRRDGMVGEILNMVLSPSHRLQSEEDRKEMASLLEAERRGRSLGQCEDAYPTCPISLFNAVDAATDYTGSILDALADHDEEAESEEQQLD